MGGYSATQIYQMFQHGPGPSRMYDAQDGAGYQVGAQDDVNDQILQLNQKMASAWGGTASEQAQSGAVPLANAAQDASNALAQHQAVLSNQADAFNTARNSVTNVPSQMPTNLGNDLLAVVGDTGPLDNQVSQYNASSQHNVQVYQTYAQTSSATASDMPQVYGQIPVNNATITVVSPSSVGASGARYSAMGVVGGGGGISSEGEYAASRLTAPPGAGDESGTELSGASEGSGAGTIDVPPGGGGGWNLPGLPNEPNINTNVSGWIPPGETEDPQTDLFPGAIGGGNSDDEDNSNGKGSPNPPFTGSLNPGGGFGGAGGGGGANAANSLHAGTAGSGANSSDITNSSRSGSGIGMNAASEETMMGSGIAGPGGAAGEGGMPMGGMGGGHRGEEDQEHKAAQYLQEADPDALFGTDEMTAPPVIGE